MKPSGQLSHSLAAGGPSSPAGRCPILVRQADQRSLHGLGGRSCAHTGHWPLLLRTPTPTPAVKPTSPGRLPSLGYLPNDGIVTGVPAGRPRLCDPARELIIFSGVDYFFFRLLFFWCAFFFACAFFAYAYFRCRRFPLTVNLLTPAGSRTLPSTAKSHSVKILTLDSRAAQRYKRAMVEEEEQITQETHTHEIRLPAERHTPSRLPRRNQHSPHRAPRVQVEVLLDGRVAYRALVWLPRHPLPRVGTRIAWQGAWWWIERVWAEGAGLVSPVAERDGAWRGAPAEVAADGDADGVVDDSVVITATADVA